VRVNVSECASAHVCTSASACTNVLVFEAVHCVPRAPNKRKKEVVCVMCV
jgi:hypothetical protein